ncbi:metal-dependent hydrolase [Geminocystis sp. NIES-3709]|uniref:metal-dependent hydrolase n=1 Tax=Geminocystis sp. NIES-3709 TaxID=1617448 RepID=UPI0005FC932E|nr:metal-dependent hydrolase [Geminocystis sp. NIES-3709]BAQ63929.1 membrane-bound metal-dependent hydrolase YdjM [Geminocystis sp. NIES-3709]
MKAISHSLTGVIATSFLISTNPIYLSIASIVALLPDCDTSTSTLGRVYPFKFLAKWIEKRYPHRSITHSFLITGLIILLSSPLILINPILWKTICLSYFVGWFGDVFTKSGVCAFYPSQARLIIPGNPRLRLSTNSPAEYWLISLFVIILIISFYLNNFGSITNAFNNFLRLPSGAIEQIRKDISDSLITINIKGYHTITKEKINDDFEVIELLTSTDFLGKKDNVFYRIGTSANVNINVSSMKIINQKPINIRSTEITIDDDYITEYLEEFSDSAFITGNLFTEDWEDLIIPNRADIFNPIVLNIGGNLFLQSAQVKEVKQYLDDAFVTGTIIVRELE